MNVSLRKIVRDFLPILLLIHLAGIETVPGNKIFNEFFLSLFWDVTKYLIPVILASFMANEVVFMSYGFISIMDIAHFFIFVIQVTVAVSILFSSHKVLVLLKKVSNLTNMLKPFKDHKPFKRLIGEYLLLMWALFRCLQISVYNSRARNPVKEIIRNSTLIETGFEGCVAYLKDLSFGICVWKLNGIYTSFPGFYCFTCLYMKKIVEKYLALSKELIDRHEFDTMLLLYQYIVTTITYMDNFLCYTVFVFIFTSTIGLFFCICVLVYNVIDDFWSYVACMIGAARHFLLLFIVLLPAADVNDLMIKARYMVLSLSALSQTNCERLRLLSSQAMTTEIYLSVWKIYKIQKKLLFSVMCTLASYGLIAVSLYSLHMKT